MKKKITELQPSNCNCLNLRRASLAVTKIYDRFITPSGLTISQYALLKHIKLLGPVSVSDLSLDLRFDRTTLVRGLKPLEKAGLILDDSPKGSRNRQLRLSEKGKEQYNTANIYWNKAQDFIEQQLGIDNLNVLTDLLHQIEKME